MTGAIEAIWIAEAESAPMDSCESIRALEARGLAGDRYARGTGYYSGFDDCAVTLVEAEALATIHEERGIDLWDGQHRRNVVTRGVSVEELLDVRFRIGETLLEGTRPRPPCAHVEDVADSEGVAQALGEGRGGICASVVESGAISVGDGIEPVESVGVDPDELAAAIRERQDDHGS